MISIPKAALGMGAIAPIGGQRNDETTRRNQGDRDRSGDPGAVRGALPRGSRRRRDQDREQGRRRSESRHPRQADRRAGGPQRRAVPLFPRDESRQAKRHGRSQAPGRCGAGAPAGEGLRRAAHQLPHRRPRSSRTRIRRAQEGESADRVRAGELVGSARPVGAAAEPGHPRAGRERDRRQGRAQVGSADAGAVRGRRSKRGLEPRGRDPRGAVRARA